MLKTSNKEKFLKNNHNKEDTFYTKAQDKDDRNISSKTMQASRQGKNIFTVLIETKCKPWILLAFLVLVAQLYPILCNPMNCSPPGSSVHGISQTTILEWVAIPFSRGSSQPRNQTRISYVSFISGRFFTIWAIPSKNIFKDQKRN